MKRLLTFVGLLVAVVGSFAQSITIDGLTYNLLSEADKTVELVSGSGASGDVVVPTSITVPPSQVLSMSWTTQSGPEWTSSENEAGKTVYRSGAIANNESTVLRCTFKAKGTIVFVCRYQGENACDYLTIGNCDSPCTRTSYGTSLQNTSGTWSSIIIMPEDENEHYIEFCYSKDYGISIDPGCAEVYVGGFEGGAYRVTSIAAGASFYGNTQITSLTIPESFTEFTTIQSEMFRRCTALKSVSLPVATSVGDDAFSGCSSLASVNLPVATSVGGSAFSGCSSLASVSLPVATSVGDDAFSGCSSLASVNLPAATSVGDDAFYGCSSLASVNLPVATSVGDYAFYGCSSLASVSLPKVTTIGRYAFCECDNICHLELPEARELGAWALESMSSLRYLSIPKVEKISGGLFDNGTRIDTLHVGSIEQYCNIEYASKDVNSFEYIYQFPFGPYNYSPDNYSSNHYLLVGDAKSPVTEITIPSTVKQIPDYAFNKVWDIHTIHLQNATPTKQVSASSLAPSAMYVVPDQAYQDYLAADVYRDIPLRITKEGCINDTIEIEADGGTSKLLEKMGKDKVRFIVNLKVKGSLNSYDMLIIRNQMTGLRSLDLTEASIVDCNYNYSNVDGHYYHSIKDVVTPDWLNGLMSVKLPRTTRSIADNAFSRCSRLMSVVLPDGVTSIGCYAFYNCNKMKEINLPDSIVSIGSSAFENCYGLISIKLPKNLKSIGSSAFENCYGLISIKLPKNLKSIGSSAFSSCRNIETLEFSDSITYIGSYAFSGCSKIKKFELPPYLKTIGSYAFQYCSSLSEVLLPASITQIQDYAFEGCSNMNRVISTTVEPVAINQNTFSTYKTATLFTPATSYSKYFWNTQWNQFLDCREYDEEFAKTFGYKYFYLTGNNGDKKEDLELDDETGPIHGVVDEETGGEKAPDADFGDGAGMVVGGEQVQELGDVHIQHNGNNGASVIAEAEGMVHIQNLYVDIKVQRNRWYFFCFPFDINPAEVKYDGSYVWYLYDGEIRAKNGNGGWKKLSNQDVLESGKGYIFQGAKNGTLSIHVQDVTIDASDKSSNMITYQSGNKNDANWNLIGNSNYAYYDLENLGYEAPVTVYNNETGNYESVRLGDDDYAFYPFQAFFVQKPSGMETIDFKGNKKETRNKSNEKKAAKAAARREAPRKAEGERRVINLELVDCSKANDSVAVSADRTRVVVNPAKSMAYETDCDAAKFMAEGLPQIYTLDAQGGSYSINERPVGNGIIPVVVKAPKAGAYTIVASRMDCDAQMRDKETGLVYDLAKGGYSFFAEAGTYTDRFQLLLGDAATAISTPGEAKESIDVEPGLIVVKGQNADVKVYTLSGALVAKQKGAGNLRVAAGTYVVMVNGQSVKVVVKE